MSSLSLITMENCRGRSAWWQFWKVPNQTDTGRPRVSRRLASVLFLFHVYFCNIADLAWPEHYSVHYAWKAHGFADDGLPLSEHGGLGNPETFHWKQNKNYWHHKICQRREMEYVIRHLENNYSFCRWMMCYSSWADKTCCRWDQYDEIINSSVKIYHISDPSWSVR